MVRENKGTFVIAKIEWLIPELPSRLSKHEKNNIYIYILDVRWGAKAPQLTRYLRYLGPSPGAGPGLGPSPGPSPGPGLALALAPWPWH